MKTIFINILLSLLNPSSDIVGIWDVNKDNTLVRIYEVNNLYYGEILSSDNPTAKKGTIILKDLKFESEKWIGEFYSIKLNKTLDAEIEIKNNTLKIKVSAGIISKTSEWEKMK